MRRIIQSAQPVNVSESGTRDLIGSEPLDQSDLFDLQRALDEERATIEEPLSGWGESTHALILREDEAGNDCRQYYHVALS